VCVSNGPLPYHTPILNALADLTPLHVLYMSRGHPLGSFDDLWGETPRFQHTFHWSKSLGRESVDFRAQLSVGAAFPLRRLDPDVVLVSSWGPLVWEPLLWTRLMRRGGVVWAESTESSGLARGHASDGVRKLVLRMADAFVANGTRAGEYLRYLGVADKRIVTSRLPAAPRYTSSRPWDRRMNAIRLLFVGRLIPQKRPLDAIRALAVLGRSDVRLTIVGDGPLYPAVDREATAAGEHVSILGRLEGRELDAIYAASDVLLVTSEREVWGLVVNEGLAHGLYVIASDKTPSAVDLIDGRNGEIIQTANIGALAQAIARACDSVDFSRAGREARAATISNVTPSSFADDILRATIMARDRS
jgi:glycosyltransferase involved in cell wall biosynthesis